MTENRTQPGPIRRQAARLAQLGLVASCEPNIDRTRYTITTTAGDVATYPREQVPAYLDGLAHAAWIQEVARTQQQGKATGARQAARAVILDRVRATDPRRPPFVEPTPPAS